MSQLYEITVVVFTTYIYIGLRETYYLVLDSGHISSVIFRNLDPDPYIITNPHITQFPFRISSFRLDRLAFARAITRKKKFQNRTTNAQVMAKKKKTAFFLGGGQSGTDSSPFFRLFPAKPVLISKNVFIKTCRTLQQLSKYVI